MPETYRLRSDAPEEYLAAAAVWLEHHGVETQHVPPDALVVVGAREAWVQAYALDDLGYLVQDGKRVVERVTMSLRCQFPREAGEALRVEPAVAQSGPP